jgi:hypothetical protein
MKWRHLTKGFRKKPKQPTLHRDVQLTLNLQTRIVADPGERPGKSL